MAPLSRAVRAENAVGRGVTRLDAEAKIKGQARYADDLVFPEVLHGKAIHSDRPPCTHPSSRFEPGFGPPQSGLRGNGEGHPRKNCVPIIYEDMPLLAEEVVRYVSEPIALLAAETREDAEEAGKLARIEYEDLPAVLIL